MREGFPGSREELQRALLGKRAAVLGIGESNIPVIEFLAKHGVRVTACDRKSRDELRGLERLSGLDIEYRLGEGYLEGLEKFDLIFPTPGMPLDLPELVRARAAGVHQSSEMDLFMRLCRAPIIGITGSDGKTTTTTLTGEVFRMAGREVFVGGNIGRSLLPQVFDIPPDAVVVLELSSFQLQPLEISPHVGVILNVHENHLDHHRSMEEYAQAKSNIVRYQGARDFAVLNLDNDITREMMGISSGTVIPFSRREEPEQGSFLHGDELIMRWGDSEILACTRRDIKLRGEHNIENVLAVVAVTWAILRDFEPLRRALAGFSGVAHRLEFCGEVNGVSFYDDSIATTPSRAMAGMAAFEEPLILIAGGSDKNLSFDEFAGMALRRCKAIVLLGRTALRIGEAIDRAAIECGEPNPGQGRGSGHPPVVYASDLEDAVHKAYGLARRGDVVLLSPACASFDMFRDYKERGDKFKSIVKELGAVIHV